LIFFDNIYEDIKVIILLITNLKALDNVKRITIRPKKKKKKGKRRNFPEEKLYCKTEIKIPAELVARMSVSQTKRLFNNDTRKAHKTSYNPAQTIPKINEQRYIWGKF